MATKKNNFESQLAQLESIVNKLEQKGTTLTEGIELFEKGVGLTKECLTTLNESRGKVTIIKKELDKLMEEPFDEAKK